MESKEKKEIEENTPVSLGSEGLSQRSEGASLGSEGLGVTYAEPIVRECGSPGGEFAGPKNQAGWMHRRPCRLTDANQVKWPSNASEAPRLGQGGQDGMAVTLVFFYGSAALFVRGVGRARPNITSRQRSWEDGRRPALPENHAQSDQSRSADCAL
jgi:hypothetical protein